MKKLFVLLILLIILSSCTATIHPIERREPEHRKHMCTEKYYSKDHHCRHDNGKHKGHYKHDD